MAGLLMLTYAVHPVMLGAFAVLHGVAWGLRGPFMQAMRADYFGLQAIGMIMGLSAFVIAIGQVLGPMVAGMFADATGNYRMGFTLLALVAGPTEPAARPASVQRGQVGRNIARILLHHAQLRHGGAGLDLLCMAQPPRHVVGRVGQRA
eukprot:gene20035-25655_t